MCLFRVKQNVRTLFRVTIPRIMVQTSKGFVTTLLPGKEPMNFYDVPTRDTDRDIISHVRSYVSPDTDESSQSAPSVLDG